MQFYVISKSSKKWGFITCLLYTTVFYEFWRVDENVNVIVVTWFFGNFGELRKTHIHKHFKSLKNEWKKNGHNIILCRLTHKTNSEKGEEMWRGKWNAFGIIASFS